MRVIVTGAIAMDNLLGTAIGNAFKRAHHEVYGHLVNDNHDRRARSPEKRARRRWEQLAPDLVIYTQSLRRRPAKFTPYSVQQPEILNDELPGYLASLAASLSNRHRFIYISTDNVFDGTSPPYLPDSVPNPIHPYGHAKLAAERSVTPFAPYASVLRVPTMYGPYSKPMSSEKAVRDQSGRTYKMDDWQRLHPTNHLDVADFLVRLVTIGKPLPPIIHYTSPETYTKYTLCQTFSRLFDLAMTHITPDRPDPPPEDKPWDCRLSLKETDLLMASAADGEGGRNWQGKSLEEWYRAWFAGGRIGIRSITARPAGGISIESWS